MFATYRVLWVLAAVGGLVTGCSSSAPDNTAADGAGVAQQSQTTAAVSKVVTGSHRVNPGDTLWSIAFRFGWDWKELAQLNGIQPPYVIRTGQVIRFDGSGTGVSKVAPVASAPAPLKSIQQQPSQSQNVLPVKKLSPSTLTPVVAPPAIASVPVALAPDAGLANWAWPVKGQVISQFSASGSLNKGIDIAGQLGQPVLAAADGSVVYAGSGLRGYGELVIIKHNDTFVSAYGHNQKLLVREGQQVKVGQTIAEMGSTGTDRVKLHFEIRRQGKPVDPMQYLPNR